MTSGIEGRLRASYAVETFRSIEDNRYSRRLEAFALGVAIGGLLKRILLVAIHLEHRLGPAIAAVLRTCRIL
jgi:hypothetical protein